MFSYNLKLAAKSMQRNPVMTGLMIAAIAVGIGVSMTTLTVYYMMSGNPIPHKSERLLAVTMDSWNPLRPFDDDRPERAPHQLTFHDSERLIQMARARRQAAMFESSLIVQPSGDGEVPFEVGARVTTRDFFEMFEVPFEFGSGWDESAEESEEYVVVLTKAFNDKVFGGENSVGEWLTMQGKRFRVVGVIKNWEPVPRFYDPINGPFQEVNEIFIPLSLTRNLFLMSTGSDWGWKSEDIETFEQWLNSESVWLQYFIELESPRDRDEYIDHLNAYVTDQKALGRFERPLNNNLYDVGEWLEYHEVVARDSKVLLGLSFLFLIVCVLSTVALVLTKFVNKKGETSLRRALGASRTAIFRQQIVEVGVIGFTGGVLGLLLAVGGLQGIDALYDTPDGLVRMDWLMMLVAIGLAVLSALIAGLYPAWRVCSIQPAAQLKTQ